MNIQPCGISRSIRMVRLVWRWPLVFLMAATMAGCMQPLPMSEPVAKPGPIQIDHAWAGFWVRPATKNRPAYEATIYPWSRDEYLVAVYVGPKSYGFFKAWPVKIAGHDYLQCQWFKPRLLYTPAEKAVAVKKINKMKPGYYQSLFLKMIKTSHHGFIRWYGIVQVKRHGQSLVVHPFIGPLGKKVNAELPPGGFANAQAIRAFIASKQGQRLLQQRTWIFQRTGRKAFQKIQQGKAGVRTGSSAPGKKSP